MNTYTIFYRTKDGELHHNLWDANTLESVIEEFKNEMEI